MSKPPWSEYHKMKGMSSMCKQINSVTRATSALSNMFNVLNEVCFENKLSKAQVVPERVKGAYGCFWVRKQYHIYHSDEWSWKIAINPRHFDLPIEEIAAILLHEMCHQYAAENDIQDCSRGGTYHNKRYADIALSTGMLTCEKVDKYGWTDTHATDKLVELCIEREWTEFCFTEGTKVSLGLTPSDAPKGGTADTTTTTKQSSRKHVCPCCGAIARTTKDIPLICGTCKVNMEQED